MIRKCRNPEQWICDVCGECGGICCGRKDMYHDGDKSWCWEHIPDPDEEE